MPGSSENERMHRDERRRMRQDLLRDAFEKKRQALEEKAATHAARHEQQRRAAQARRMRHQGGGPDRGGVVGLVWMRDEPKRGRAHRPMLSQEEIVRTAVRVADAAGIEAVSMRYLAHQLHAGAMSLYWYMSSKEDLLDLMVDEVYAEVDPPAGPTGDWRADLRLSAGLLRRAIKRHPWFPAVAAGRPPIGPNALRSTEFGLAALEGVGLDVRAMLGTLTTVSDYVLGFTLSEVAEQEAWRRSGLTERQWRKLVSPYLQRLAESGEFPRFTHYVAEADHAMGDDERFSYGLECMLDGIAARVGQPGGSGVPHP